MKFDDHPLMVGRSPEDRAMIRAALELCPPLQEPPRQTDAQKLLYGRIEKDVTYALTAAGGSDHDRQVFANEEAWREMPASELAERITAFLRATTSNHLYRQAVEDALEHLAEWSENETVFYAAGRRYRIVYRPLCDEEGCDEEAVGWLSPTSNNLRTCNVHLPPF